MSPLALSLRFLQTQPDSRLVELARAGHERAFEALVQRYRRPLLAYCRRITASDASAEDALQQALLQAWVALSTSPVEVRDARAWLYRIVHNVAVSNLRRTVPDSVEIDEAEGASGADHEVERRFAVREALAGLASLPELQRRVMLSTALEGRSHDEIADALGLSHGAVRGLIYRARATLRAAAAALTPAPVVHWAVRQQSAGSGRSAGFYEAIAGGGGAGLGGVLIKGGAIVVSAGAIATAAGITHTHSHHDARHRVVQASPLKQASAQGGRQAAAGAVSVAGAQLVAARSSAAARGNADARRGRSGHGGGGGSSHGRGHRGDQLLALAGSPHQRSGRGSSGSGDSRAPGSGSSHHSGGSDGGSSGGGSGGGSGGDHHGSGHDGSRTGTLTSSGGGSGGGHGGGGEGGTLSSSTTVTSSDGGTGDGRSDASGGTDGGGGGGSTTTGSVTTVTTTSTTTSGSATSGD